MKGEAIFAIDDETGRAEFVFREGLTEGREPRPSVAADPERRPPHERRSSGRGPARDRGIDGIMEGPVKHKLRRDGSPYTEKETG